MRLESSTSFITSSYKLTQLSCILCSLKLKLYPKNETKTCCTERNNFVRKRCLKNHNKKELLLAAWGKACKQIVCISYVESLTSYEAAFGWLMDRQAGIVPCTGWVIYLPGRIVCRHPGALVTYRPVLSPFLSLEVPKVTWSRAEPETKLSDIHPSARLWLPLKTTVNQVVMSSWAGIQTHWVGWTCLNETISKQQLQSLLVPKSLLWLLLRWVIWVWWDGALQRKALYWNLMNVGGGEGSGGGIAFMGHLYKFSTHRNH